LVVGLILVLLGAWFLIVQFVPGLQIWFSWPLIIVGVGVFLLLLGLVLGAPGMVVPACIVGGIGGMLYWQNATGHWESWAYAWALIPGFVGVGVLLLGLLEREAGQVRGGAWLIVISLVIFVAFGSFFGALTFLGVYWPVLLIALGALGLVNALFRPRR
jgi:hypothetical protein